MGFALKKYFYLTLPSFSCYAYDYEKYCTRIGTADFTSPDDFTSVKSHNLLFDSDRREIWHAIVLRNNSRTLFFCDVIHNGTICLGF